MKLGGWRFVLCHLHIVLCEIKHVGIIAIPILTLPLVVPESILKVRLFNLKTKYLKISNLTLLYIVIISFQIDENKSSLNNYYIKLGATFIHYT